MPLKAKNDAGALSARMNGDALTPEDPEYDRARRVWNGMIDVRPAVIARCRTTSDVMEAVRYAADRGLRTSVRGGGHNVAGLALVDGGLVLDLSPMRAVRVDLPSRTVRVQGGATLGDIDRVTNRHGLMMPSGFISKTGIGGLTLKGGLGHTMRRCGLACDNMLGAEIVTANGDVLRIDDGTDAEALWALRGGPFTLGAVTEFTFRLRPVPPEVRLIVAAFPASQGVEMNRFMRDYMREAPRELGLVSFYVTLPDEDGYPRAVRGREVIVLFGMYTGDQNGSKAVLEPIVDRRELLADLGGWMPYPAAQSALDADYPDGLRYYWKSLYLADLDDDVLQIIHDFGRQRPSPASTLDIWTMGGAVAEVDEETSAFPQRKAGYMVAIESNWGEPSQDTENVEWARRVFGELRDRSTGGIYLNFPGSREEHHAAIANVYAPAMDRLNRVRDRLDPDRQFT